MKDLPAVKQPSEGGQNLSNGQVQSARSWTGAPSLSTPNQPESFIKGLLILNKDGATYEGIVYDRRLRLRFPNGGELTVFDFVGPIGESLQVGETYEMVLCPLVPSVDLVPGSTSPAEAELGLRGSRWQGLVQDLEWEAPKNAFRFAREEFYSGSWVLIATPLGHVIMAQEDLREPLQAGTVIQWECTMPYLYAVV